MDDGGFYLKYNFQKTSLYQNINVNHIKKIMMIHNVQECFSKQILIRENNINKYLFHYNQGTEISLRFQKLILLNSLSSVNNVKCISIMENKSYDLDNCSMIFKQDYLINFLKLNCKPRDMGDFYVDDLKIFKDGFCHPNQTLAPYLTEYFFELRNKSCPPPCENEFVTVDSEQKPHHDKIKINLIPKFNFKPIFTHSLSMDYNNLIYDLGGTIGIWIGWSALTIPIHIYEMSKILSYQIIRNFIFIVFTAIFSKSQYLLTKLISFFKFLFNFHHKIITSIKNIFFHRRLFQNRVIPIR